MSRKGDIRKLIRDVEKTGLRTTLDQKTSVYNVTTKRGEHVCKLSWTAEPQAERRKVASALRKIGLSLGGRPG